MEDNDGDLSTSVTVTRAVLANLRLVKAEMSKTQGRTMHYPEVVQELISCWHERQQKEGRRV